MKFPKKFRKFFLKKFCPTLLVSIMNLINFIILDLINLTKNFLFFWLGQKFVQAFFWLGQKFVQAFFWLGKKFVFTSFILIRNFIPDITPFFN
jgi:hypothetical protein